MKVPLVVRLEGTNVDQGKRILKVNDPAKFFINSILCLEATGIKELLLAGEWHDHHNSRRPR